MREREGGGSVTFTTWLYVANVVGVEENLRAIEGVFCVQALGMERGSLTEGTRNLRMSETAIVDCGR